MEPKHYFYQSENFGPYNRAVDADIRRHDNLSRALISQAKVNKSLVLLRWSGAAAMLTIAVSFAIWLATMDSRGSHGYTTTSSKINVEETVREVQQNTPQLDPLIKTSFTVFETTITDSGQRVVTGRKYEPTDLEFPASQYCYLELDSETIGGPITENYDSVTKDLASKEAKSQIETAVRDPMLTQIAIDYCRFI